VVAKFSIQQIQRARAFRERAEVGTFRDRDQPARRRFA
jgi:hypothetical protein